MQVTVNHPSTGSNPVTPAFDALTISCYAIGMKCKWHLCDNEVVPVRKGGNPKLFCNEKCTRKQAVSDKRKRLRIQMLDYKGRKCERCGWDESPVGLAAHHTDPTQKEFSMGDSGITRSWERIKAELDKCVMLCHNCHSVIHSTKDPLWLK